MLKRLIVAISIACSLSLSFADTNSDLQSAFHGLGFEGHANDPTAYQSQSAGYATFGSIYERNKVRDIQIMHIDVPGFRSGCGGIDMWAGAMSFIKADQITKFMQSVLSSGAGYALNLALETELPEVAHALQYMQEVANKINSGNFNSCEMGEDLVGGLWPKNRASQQQVCQDIGTHSGAFTDWASSRQGCGTGSDEDTELDKAKSDPKYKYRVYKNTNIIWDRVVQRNDFLSHDEKLGELYMSISGTLVFDKEGAITPYPSKVTDSDFIKALLYGGKLPTYVCKDDVKGCVDVSYSPSDFQTISEDSGLVMQVRKMLNDIYTRLTQDEPLTDEEKGMIQITQSPVFSIISVNAEEGIGVQGIEALSEMVATDILSDYLSNALDVINSSLAGTALDKGNIQDLLKSIQDAQKYVSDLDTKTKLKYQQAVELNQSVQAMQKEAMSQLSTKLKVAVSQQGE